MSRYTASVSEKGRMSRVHFSKRAGRTDGWKIDGYQVNIAASNWVMFKPHEKDLIMKMFEITLDDYIKKAKKSHRVMLKCLWKNIGCYKKGEKY